MGYVRLLECSLGVAGCDIQSVYQVAFPVFSFSFSEIFMGEPGKKTPNHTHS